MFDNCVWCLLRLSNIKNGKHVHVNVLMFDTLSKHHTQLSKLDKHASYFMTSGDTSDTKNLGKYGFCTSVENIHPCKWLNGSFMLEVMQTEHYTD